MANEYAVNQSDLTTVADAIRTKGGTSDTLAFPDGFVSAIDAIEAGGGGDEWSDALKGIIERTAAEITLPSDLTSIGNYAFYGCSNLALTSLPSGVTSIGNYAFQNCSNLALTSLPSGVTSIGSGVFQNCSNLALTSLPSGVTSIGGSTFSNCTKLTTLSLPSGLKSIGNYAFSGCKGLTAITFEGTPTGTINSSVFNNCTNLLTINVPWAEGAVSGAPWGATNATINYNYTGG